MAETFARGRQVGPGELGQIRAVGKTDAGSQVREVPPSRQALRAALTEGKCPFCGESKFHNLAGHTNRTHGYSAAELRELAGMLKGAPLCSPEFSEKRRVAMDGRRLPDSAYVAEKRARTFSEAGLVVQREKLAKAKDDGLQHVGWAPEVQARASAASAAKRLTENADKHARAAALWAEGFQLKAIADAVGMTYGHVKRGLLRSGIEVGDLRSERHKRHT